MKFLNKKIKEKGKARGGYRKRTNSEGRCGTATPQSTPSLAPGERGRPKFRNQFKAGAARR